MRSTRYRALHVCSQVVGAFRRKDETHLHVQTSNLFGRTSQQLLDTASLTRETTLGDTAYLPIRAQIQEDRLKISLPATALVQEASFLGWTTVWNGQAIELGQQSKGIIELSLPARGWWKIEIPSAEVQLFFSASSKRSLGYQFKGIPQALQAFAIAVGFHAFIYYAATGNFSQYLQTSEMAAEDAQPTEVAESQQVIETVDSEGESFQGTSLYRALNRQAERNFKATDVAKDLKNMGTLFKNIKMTAKSPSKQGLVGAAGNTGLNQSLKSLQAGLFSRRANPIQPTAVQKPASVQWKPQFLTAGNGKSGKGISEAQLQKVLDLFASSQEKFRACYEGALLQFDEMAVTASFEATISDSGSIGQTAFKITGRSTPESEESLVKCLKNAMSHMKLDPKLSGAKIRNQFMFKS